jgi:hypothetical protein
MYEIAGLNCECFGICPASENPFICSFFIQVPKLELGTVPKGMGEI